MNNSLTLPSTQSPHPTLSEGRGKDVSLETVKTALEAVRMVYKFNIPWLQVNGREQEFLKAIEELEKVAK